MNLFGDETIEDDYSDNDGNEFELENSSKINQSQSLLTPSASLNVYGHDAIEQDIIRLWNDNRLPHSLIFNGIKGIGKASFTYRLSRFILKNKSKPQVNFDIPANDSLYSKIASGGHPDILTIGRPFDEKKGQFKEEIPVDEIRKVMPFFRKTSSQTDGWRIVIIDDADTMNRAGQNALLKILEEPPSNALIILITHGAGGLIPTIRSRCRFFRFSCLSQEHMTKILSMSSHQHLLGNDIDLIWMLSQGSIGHALYLLEDDGIASIYMILEALNNIESLSLGQINDISLIYTKSGNNTLYTKFKTVLNRWFEIKIDLAAKIADSQIIGGINFKLQPHENLQYLLNLHEDIDAHIKACDNGSIDKHYIVYKILRMIQNG